MKTFNKYIYLMFFAVTFLFAACSEDTSDTYFTPVEPDISMDQKNLTIPKEGGEYTINVKSNLPWRASVKDSWVTLDTENGMSDGSFKITVGINRSLEPRETELYLWITDDDKKVLKVYQEPSEASELIMHYYVKESGEVNADGLSWATATTLEMALDKAVRGDFIYVAAGTYTPTRAITNGSTDNASDKTFEIHSNINIIGGYPADATEGAEADPTKNTTILSGKLESGNAYHVVTITASVEKDQKVTLKGLTITEGEAAASGAAVNVNGNSYNRTYAGGMIIGGSVVDIIDCNITDNASAGAAAGMYVFNGATVWMKNSIVQGNKGLNDGKNGGGIYNDASTMYIIESQILNNAINGVGCGIYSFNSTKPTYTYIYNSLIAGNTTGSNMTRKGAGFYGREHSVTIMVNTTIHSNRGGVGAGIGMHGADGKASKLDVINCTISGNEAFTSDAGFQGQTHSTINFHNSIISGNIGGDGSGGAITYTNSVFGTSVYGMDGTTVAGLSFDYATMLDKLLDNGGATNTCLLLGDNNPAKENGMTVDALENLGKNMSPVIESDIITKDQIGLSRAGKKYMGACVK